MELILFVYRIIGFKGPLRSLSPTVNLTLQNPPVNHVTKYHGYKLISV